MPDYTPKSDGSPSDESIPATFGANKVVGDIYPQGADDPFQRLTDSVRGGGLFTTNSDPNVVGIDPATGVTAPVGSDVGFSAPMRRFLQAGVYNGDMSARSPDTTAPIGADNVLPYWRWVNVSGSAITAQWLADSTSGSGGVLQWTMTAGAAADEAYIEAFLPIIGTRGQNWAHGVRAYFLASITSGGSPNGYLTVQYVKNDLVTTTGTVDTVTLTLGALARGYAAYPNTSSAPADAAYIRVRIGVARGAAATSATLTAYLSDVYVVAGAEMALVQEGTSPNTYNALRITQDSAVARIAPNAAAGAYVEVNGNWPSSGGVNSPVYSTASSAVVSAMPVGRMAYQFPPGYGHDMVTTGNASLAVVAAGLGGTRAIPFFIPSVFVIEGVTLWQTNVASLRTAEWRLYYDLGQGSNTLQYASASGTFSFTPAAADLRTSTAAAPQKLAPGAYWLVIRNTSTTQTFNIGTVAAGTLATNIYRQSSAEAALGATIDISTWLSQTPMILVRLNGRIGAETAPF